MIYIKSTTNSLTIPARTAKVSGTFSIVMTNGVTGKSYTISGLIDLSNSSMYYYFRISNIPSIPVGEYNYILRTEDTTADSGLLQYGEYAKTPNQTKYYHRERQIKTYQR